ncbi:MAG: hypothetical protein RL713_1515 [Bacteroidota bacterium]|jgi:hypothetical protein
MLRKLSLFICLALVALTSFAQEDSTKKSNWTFTGFVDGYFRSDFNQNLSNNRTSFTNSNNKLALGMVSAKVDYAYKKFSFTADLGAGKRAEEFAYNDKGVLSYVKQLYASYAPTEWLKLSAGTWATHVGYELVDPYANRNYSMSYMFSYGPFLHTGVKADFTFGTTGFMIGVANPTDYRKAPTDSKKFTLLQWSQAINEDVKIYLNYVGGQRPGDSAKSKQIDLVVTAKINDEFGIGFNGTVNSIKLQKNNIYEDASSWSGAAVYLNYDPVEKLGLTLRTEMFNDKNQLSALGSALTGTSILANTLSANVKFGKFTIIPELRYETAGKNIYFAKDGASKSSDVSFLIGAYFKL